MRFWAGMSARRRVIMRRKVWLGRCLRRRVLARRGLMRWYGRTAGKACTVLLADAGRRAPDTRAIRSNVATDRAVSPSGKLTMIARPVIRVAEDKGGGKSV